MQLKEGRKEEKCSGGIFLFFEILNQVFTSTEYI